MNFKLSNLVAATLAGSLLMGFGANAMADSTDDIVNALIAKGVLTEEEGALLMRGREGEKEAAAEKKKTAIIPKFNNGLVFENEDKSVSFKVGGRVHADYRNFDRNIKDDATTLQSAGNEADTFDIRRARIELSGKFYDAYDFLISTDLAGTNAGNTTSVLDQAWFNVNYWKFAQFRFGQFKAPMNLEKLTSSNNTDFQERSFENQLAPNEDRGVMLWGIPKDGYTYALAVTTGEGAKNRNDADPRVDNVEYVGRGTVNFAQIMDNKDNVYHVGASASYTELTKGLSATTPTPVVGGATVGTTATTSTNGYLSGTNAVRTEARGINFFNVPGINSIAGVDNSIERTRYGVEAAAAFGPVKVQSEWIRNNFQGDNSTTSSFDKNIDAWYAEALWLVTGEKYADSYKDGAWGGIKPKNNFQIGKEGVGAWEIGVRYSKFDASDFKNYTTSVAQNAANKNLNISRINANTANATNTLEADSWTLGIKFIPTANTRFLVNFIQTNFDTPILLGTKLEDKERAVTARAQFNF